MPTLNYQPPVDRRGRSVVELLLDLVVGSWLVMSGLFLAVLDNELFRRVTVLDWFAEDRIAVGVIRIRKGSAVAAEELERRASKRQLRDRYGS